MERASAWMRKEAGVNQSPRGRPRLERALGSRALVSMRSASIRRAGAWPRACKANRWEEGRIR